MNSYQNNPAPAVTDAAAFVGPEFGAGPGRPVVLIVTANFPPDSLSGAARPGRFARYLPQFGYEPVVICQSSPEQTVGSAVVRRVPSAAPRTKTRILARVGYHFQRRLLPYDDRLPWVAHALAEAEAVVASRPVAAVFSTSPPAAVHLVALRLKQRYGLPWVADFRDPLQGNPFRARRWFFPYDVLLERLLFRHADALIANTETVAEMWRRRHCDLAAKMTVLGNGFDPEDRAAPLPLPDRPRRVLAHVGSLYGGRHPGRLLDSLARLIHQGDLDADRICVRFVGPYEERSLRISQKSVEFLKAVGCLESDGKHVSQAEARQAGAQADYLLLLDLNDQDADLQVPAKLFEYIQYGRPILAFTRRGSPTERILSSSGVPHRIIHQDAGDSEADRQVRDLFGLPTEPVQPSLEFETQFDGRNQTRTLAGILNLVRFGTVPLPTPRNDDR